VASVATHSTTSPSNAKCMLAFSLTTKDRQKKRKKPQEMDKKIIFK
jgi:hypothetical protein